MAQITQQGVDFYNSLTNTERKIIRELFKGKSNKDIGDFCGISESTVKRYNISIFDKAGVNSRLGLITFCFSTRLLMLSNKPMFNQKFDTSEALKKWADYYISHVKS